MGNRKYYEQPEMELVFFGSENIILTSGLSSDEDEGGTHPGLPGLPSTVAF